MSDKKVSSKDFVIKALIVLGPVIFIGILCFIEMK